MRSNVGDQNTDKVVALVGQYITVDGFYSRNGETTVRGSVDENNLGWSQPLVTELKLNGFAAKTHQNGTIVHINIFPLKEPFPWIHLLLFIATYLSASFAPAVYNRQFSVFYDFRVFLHWQQFAVPLLAILVFHEFGHYFAAKRRGIRVSLPYFLPAPTAIGTFGAFIKSNSPFSTRRDLLEVGAYGPIAGFVVAMCFLVYAFLRVKFQMMVVGGEGPIFIEPLAVRLVELLVWHHSYAIWNTQFLIANPLIFATWVGMIVTAINLLPAGQLDGGHIVYALFPKAHYWISRGTFGLLLVMGYFWLGWLLWAFLVLFVIKFRHPPTLDDNQQLDSRSKWIGWIAMAIFILTFSPMPF